MCVSIGFLGIMIWPILAALGNVVKIAYKLVLTWLANILQRGRHRRVTIVKADPVTKGSKFDGENEAVIPRML